MEVLKVNEVPAHNKTSDEAFQEQEKKRAERLELQKIEAEKFKAEKIEAEKIEAERIQKHRADVRAAIDQIVSDKLIYNRYQIGNFVGKGTYGEVYKAQFTYQDS